MEIIVYTILQVIVDLFRDTYRGFPDAYVGRIRIEIANLGIQSMKKIGRSFSGVDTLVIFHGSSGTTRPFK